VITPTIVNVLRAPEDRFARRAQNAQRLFTSGEATGAGLLTAGPLDVAAEVATSTGRIMLRIIMLRIARPATPAETESAVPQEKGRPPGDNRRLSRCGCGVGARC
jgi:hypothetical protein